MFLRKLLVFVALGWVAANGAHAQQPVTETFQTPDGPVTITYEVIGGQATYQGDIQLDLPAMRAASTALMSQRGRARRGRRSPNGIGKLTARMVSRRSADYYWPGATVPVDTSAFAGLPTRLAAITAAMAEIERSTPVRFVTRTNHKDYVAFEPSTVCNSSVGRSGGRQVIRLAPDCAMGSTMHEIFHALGVFHEQARSDRDAHVEVLWHNIKEKSHNFQKTGDRLDIIFGKIAHTLFGWAGVSDPGARVVGSYDYDSVMHYGSCAFAKNCNWSNPATFTLRRKGCNPAVAGDCEVGGQRDHLSAGDAHYLTEIYCPLATDPSRCPGALRSAMQRGDNGPFHVRPGQYGSLTFETHDYSNVTVVVSSSDGTAANALRASLRAPKRPDGFQHVHSGPGGLTNPAGWASAQTIQLVGVPPGEHTLFVSAANPGGLNTWRATLTVTPAVIGPDGYETNNTPAQARSLGGFDSREQRAPVTGLTLHNTHDRDLFTIQLPPATKGDRGECLSGPVKQGKWSISPNDKGYTPGRFTLSMNGENHGPGHTLVVYRNGAPYQTSSTGPLVVDCPHQAFPSGRVTFGVHAAGRRNYYDLRVAYQRWRAKLPGHLLPRPKLQPKLMVRIPVQPLRGKALLAPKHLPGSQRVRLQRPLLNRR